jgi:hypothetical protein
LVSETAYFVGICYSGLVLMKILLISLPKMPKLSKGTWLPVVVANDPVSQRSSLVECSIDHGPWYLKLTIVLMLFNWIASRVTKLAECSLFGWLFNFFSFFITEVAHFGTTFSRWKLCIYLSQKMVGLHLCDFFQKIIWSPIYVACPVVEFKQIVTKSSFA